MGLMHPIKVASVRASLIQRVSARACQMQGMPEAHYHLLSADQRLSYERGVYAVLAALESLECELLAPDELSPILPHDREAPE
jgi:hypothetical protein